MLGVLAISREGEMKSSCEGCDFYEPPRTCKLPIGKPEPFTKSAWSHYRHYFNRDCHRKGLTNDIQANIIYPEGGEYDQARDNGEQECTQEHEIL